MMKAGANIHQEDINGNATVHHAIDAVAMRLLMDGGANPNAINDNGETVLHLCQDQAVVQLLLEEGKVDTSLKTHRDGHTPLISLLSSENIFPVQATENALRLLEFGADASGIDNNGNGAFHHAIGIMNTTNCERLIESLRGAGANINLKNHQGKTPLQVMDVGVKGPRFPGIPWILGKFNDKLFNALLAAGADPELRDYEGQTVLFQRIKSGPPGGTELIDLCEKMTKAGARIDTVDFKGQTLFDASLSSRFPGDMSFFRFLIARGLDPKQKDYDGNTLWHKAVLYHTKMRVGVNPKAPGIFQELIRLGVDHETPNNSGRTPLHLLSSFTPIEVREGKSPSIEHTTEFDYMLGFQKNVDFVDNDGVTALHLASTFSEYQTRRLLEAGADPLKATYEKLTPFHLAARSQQSNIIGMLLDSLRLRADQDAISAAVNAEDGFGNTILHYACASGRIESVRLLIDAGAKICTGSKSPWQSCVKIEEEQANCR
jgi:ankyrin repeat protein